MQVSHVNRRLLSRLTEVDPLPFLAKMMQTTLDAWTASACDQPPRKKMRSTSCDNPLVLLSGCPELWDLMCSSLSGDAISTLASMPRFSEATKATPAWHLLSGLNNDGQLVPWNDDDNCMSCRYIPPPAGPNMRYVFANTSAYFALRTLPIPFFEHQVDGPARPSTPCNGYQHTERKLRRTNCAFYFVYDGAHSRCACAACNLNRPKDTGPPVFGIRPGFSCAPFWDVLIGDPNWSTVSDADDNSDCELKIWYDTDETDDDDDDDDVE